MECNFYFNQLFTTDITQIWFVEKMIEKHIKLFQLNKHNPIKHMLSLFVMWKYIKLQKPIINLYKKITFLLFYDTTNIWFVRQI